MTNGVHTTLNIALCLDSHDAMQRGYFYRPPIYKPINIAQVVVVGGGTQNGRPTVDIVLEDPETKQKFVVMLTGRLLKTVTDLL